MFKPVVNLQCFQWDAQSRERHRECAYSLRRSALPIGNQMLLVRGVEPGREEWRGTRREEAESEARGEQSRGARAEQSRA